MSNMNFGLYGKHDPFAGDSSDDDGFVTPPTSSPALGGVDTTPKKVRDLAKFCKKTSPDRSSLRKEKETMNDGLSGIKKMGDTPKRKRRVTKVLEIAGQVLLRLPGSANTTSTSSTVEGNASAPSFPLHAISLENLQELEATWPEELLKRLKREYDLCQHRNDLPFPYLINIEHITAPVMQRNYIAGYHFIDPDNTSSFPTQEIAKNPQSGVFAATFTTPQSNAAKLSTFFPRDTGTKEDLLTLLQTGETLFLGESRLLVTLPSKEFHVEALIKNDFIVWSCYPLLFCETYEENKQYQITETCSLSSETILEHVKKAIEKGQIMYKTLYDCVVDIAGEIPELGIPNGIYVKISRDFLPPWLA